jgi:hypothetical protein
MTKRVKLFQNERLDIEDAKNLQDMVYEYTQRAVHGILGQSDGLCGSGISASISAATWLSGGGNNVVTLSGREYIQRSNKYHFDHATSAVPEGKSGAEVPAGSGKGTGQVWVFDSDLNEQTTKVNFVTAIAKEGGPAANWLTNGPKYSIFARRKTYDADVEGRIFWDADGGGQEVQLNKPTSQSEVVEFSVLHASEADVYAKSGYVRVFDVVSVNTDPDSATYTQPTLRPHMAYDLASAKFSSSNAGNSIRTALENATANTSMSVDPTDVGGLTELLGYVVRQLGWLQEIAGDFGSKTFQKPEGDLVSLFRFLTQYRASHKMPGLLWSGIVRADRANKRWEFGYGLADGNTNTQFEDRTGATTTSQGVFIGTAVPFAGDIGMSTLFMLADDSKVWVVGPGTGSDGSPRYKPLQGPISVSSEDWGDVEPAVSYGLVGAPANANAWFDLKVDYDASKVKVVGVQATPYADVHNYDTTNLAAGGNPVTGETGVTIQTGTLCHQTPVVLVYQNAIYIRTITTPDDGTDPVSTQGRGPRSICLTIFGYHDDGIGTDGWGYNGIGKAVDADGPTIAGGQGTKNT